MDKDIDRTRNWNFSMESVMKIDSIHKAIITAGVPFGLYSEGEAS
jgi:hypothetical protein